MKTHHYIGETMLFAGIDNPFGADAFAPPASIKVKPYKLPKTKRGTRVRRAPQSLSVLKNALLNYNG